MDRTLIRPSCSHLNKKSGGFAGPSAALITRVIGEAEGNTLSPELSSPPLRGTFAKVKTAQHPTLWGSYPDLPSNHSPLHLQFATTNMSHFFLHIQLPQIYHTVLAKETSFRKRHTRPAHSVASTCWRNFVLYRLALLKKVSIYSMCKI